MGGGGGGAEWEGADGAEALEVLEWLVWRGCHVCEVSQSVLRVEPEAGGLGWLNGLKVCGDAVDQRLHVRHGLVLLRWHWLSSLFMEGLCQIIDEQVLLSHVFEEHGHQNAFSYVPRGNESHVATCAE